MQQPQQLPDLSSLNANKMSRSHLTKEAESGVYCLNKIDSVNVCNSSVLLYRNALPASKEDFEAAVIYMRENVRDDYCYQHPVPRKQCTFGPVKYKSYEHHADEGKWPALVKIVLNATQQFATQLGIPNPEEYQGVHANYYADGNSCVNKHADDEIQLVENAPIFSYTYLENNNPNLARDFTIWKSSTVGDVVEGKGRIADVTLYSGDLLVMMGNMQKETQHSIERQKRPVAARLNFTVRKFVERKDAMARKRAADGE